MPATSKSYPRGGGISTPAHTGKWEVWFAWFPTPIRVWYDWGNMTGELITKWKWLTPVARRWNYSGIRHGFDEYRDYRPAHYALTQQEGP